jgi:hypothetical protein
MGLLTAMERKALRPKLAAFGHSAIIGCRRLVLSATAC